MISDGLCTDILQEVLREKAHLSINDKSYNEAFEEVDIVPLEKYVPILFNTYSKFEKLENVISEFVKLYYLYRREFYNSIITEDGKVITIRKLTQIFYDNSPIPNKNKTRDIEIESFKKHLNAIYSFLGGSRFGTVKGHEFKKQLQEVCANADEYIPKRTKVTISTKPIKDYLLSLNLKDKSLTIDEFIKAIK